MISSYNSNTIILCCHIVYIAFITILIASSINFVILLFIYSLERSLYSSIISKKCLYIAVSMTLFIIFNKAISLYILRICFAFYNLSDLMRIMISTLYKYFRKYSYMKLVFVILAMIIVRGLLYIFSNPINR